MLSSQDSLELTLNSQTRQRTRDEGNYNRQILTKSEPQIYMKGECFVDLNYFLSLSKKYKCSQHPLNYFFNVSSTFKNRHFVELNIQNYRKVDTITRSNVYNIIEQVNNRKLDMMKILISTLNMNNQSSSLNTIDHQQQNKSIEFLDPENIIKHRIIKEYDSIDQNIQQVNSCNIKIEKIDNPEETNLNNEINNCEKNINQSSEQNKLKITQTNIFIIDQNKQRESFEKAKSILARKSPSLFKFNIFFRSREENEQIQYLKHGISISALNALQMSADFYQYVHLRFGMSPFIDNYFRKHYFDITIKLFAQQTYNLWEQSEQNKQITSVKTGQYLQKYIQNLSSVGAIYSLVDCEQFDLGNNYYMEIQYFPNEQVVSAQATEINERLRIQKRAFLYSNASALFINKYYPKAKIWDTSKNIQEVDYDVIQKIIKIKK